MKWCLEVEEKLKHYKQKIQTVTHKGRHDQNQNWTTSFKWNLDIRNESKDSCQALTCSKVSIREFSHMKLILWLKALKSKAQHSVTTKQTSEIQWCYSPSHFLPCLIHLFYSLKNPSIISVCLSLRRSLFESVSSHLGVGYPGSCADKGGGWRVGVK